MRFKILVGFICVFSVLAGGREAAQAAVSQLPQVMRAEGGWTGSGGDGYSAMFRIVCMSAAQAIQQLPYQKIPSQNYDINWAGFESACVSVRIRTFYSSEEFRDWEGSSRTALFVQTQASGPLFGEIYLNSQRFAEEMKNNLPGVLVTVVHEVLKAIGIDDDGNKTSVRVFTDYDQAFMETAISLQTRLKTLNQYAEERLAFLDQFSLADGTLQSGSTDPKSLDARLAAAKKLASYLDELINELRTELSADNVKGLELSRQYDVASEAYWKLYEDQAKKVRKQMTEFANAFQEEMQNISFMNFFPSQGGRTAAAMMRANAKLIGVRPLQPKSTEMEWMQNQIQMLAEEIEFKTGQLKSYRSKKQLVVNRFIDAETSRL